LVITGAVFGYAKFVNKISELENNMQEANNKIEELISKHIEDEEERFSEMEEQIKWYQKEFNLNPLSWRKKKDK
jgi:predicted  nucleic acid-binding Zn-ribbon protein